MTENFELKGYWFLPLDPSNKINGTLFYDGNEGGTLELFGHFKTSEINIPLVLGITVGGKEITLYKTSYSHEFAENWAIGSEAADPIHIYVVNFIFEGHHFRSIEEMQFQKLVSEIYNLDEWVGISGFTVPKLSERKRDSVTVSYNLPNQIDFELKDNLNAQFNFVASQPPFATFSKEVTIKQRVQFIIKSNQTLNLESFLNELFIFLKFIALGLYEATYPTSIYFVNATITKESAGIEVPKKIILYTHIDGSKPGLLKHFINMLYSYKFIHEDFQTIIKKWYEYHLLFEPVFNLFFSHFYTMAAFNENSFLNLAQAAETLHARLYSHTKMPKEEFDAMKEGLIFLSPASYHSWLKEQFAFGNSLTLHQRLEELLDKFSNEVTDSLIKDKAEFIKQVKYSRNYYTHYSPSLEKKALKGIELFYLSQKLKALLVSALLTVTGFGKEKTQQIMNNKKFQYFLPPK